MCRKSFHLSSLKSSPLFFLLLRRDSASSGAGGQLLAYVCVCVSPDKLHSMKTDIVLALSISLTKLVVLYQVQPFRPRLRCGGG